MLAEETIETKPVVLFVDDEQEVLRAIERTCHTQEWITICVRNGAKALELMRSQPIDVVVSDMRMPEMNGAELVSRIADEFPETVCILISGFSDLGETINAINSGNIRAYIAKPWNNEQLKLAVRNCLDYKRLNEERRGLQILTQHQNKKLNDLNSSLEVKVASRTNDLRKAIGTLDRVNQELEQAHTDSIKVFSNLFELRVGNAKHGRQVSDLTGFLADQLKVNPQTRKQIIMAALLHDIGSIGLTDREIRAEIPTLSPDETANYRRHPAIGAGLLMGIESFSEAAAIIRGHHERFDGKGFPDGLMAGEIPLGSRIISLVSDYFDLQQGRLLGEKMTESEAMEFILSASGTRYDPQIVDLMAAALASNNAIVDEFEETLMATNQLTADLVLSRDLVLPDGVLLLSRHHVLGEKLVRKILEFERDSRQKLEIYVYFPVVMEEGDAQPKEQRTQC